MAQPISRRALAAAIGTLEREKRDTLEKLSKEEQVNVQAELETKQRELAELEERKVKTQAQADRGRKELEELQRSLFSAQQEAIEEQTVFDLQRRILDFAGSDNASVKQRMVKEGWGEQLVNEMLRTRTLEQTLERPGGMPASFIPNDPLERILRGQAKLYDMTDRRVLDRLDSLRDQAVNKGYLGQEQLEELRAVEQTAWQFSQNELYKDKDDRGYITRTNEVVDSIKKQLGLDWETPGLTYAGKRL